MYNKLDRKKNPPDIKFSELKSGPVDIFAMFDDGVKDTYNITDEEYDLLAENLSDEHASLFMSNKALTYKEAKSLLLAIKDILK